MSSLKLRWKRINCFLASGLLVSSNGIHSFVSLLPFILLKLCYKNAQTLSLIVRHILKFIQHLTNHIRDFSQTQAYCSIWSYFPGLLCHVKYLQKRLPYSYGCTYQTRVKCLLATFIILDLAVEKTHFIQNFFQNSSYLSSLSAHKKDIYALQPLSNFSPAIQTDWRTDVLTTEIQTLDIRNKLDANPTFKYLLV